MLQNEVARWCGHAGDHLSKSFILIWLDFVHGCIGKAEDAERAENWVRLQRLTEDILNVTKIESQSLNLNKERFNLKDVISNAIDDITTNIQSTSSSTNYNNTIKLVYHQPQDVFIYADKGRIGQVVSNLLDNAVKFTKDGGTINIRVEKEEKGENKEKEGLKIIRFDLCFASPTPVDSPKELWMDHAIVHETANTYQDEMIDHLTKGFQTCRSPAFLRLEKMKERKYRPLLPVAKHLTSLPSTRLQALFSVPNISSLGYLNPDALRWLNG